MAIDMGTELANTVSIVKPPISSTAIINSVLRPKRSASGPKDAACQARPFWTDFFIGAGRGDDASFSKIIDFFAAET